MASENDLQQQLEQLRKDVAALAETIASLAAGKAEEVKAQAYRAGSDAAEASAHVLDAARDQVCAVQSDLEERIRAKPIYRNQNSIKILSLTSLLSPPRCSTTILRVECLRNLISTLFGRRYGNVVGNGT